MCAGAVLLVGAGCGASGRGHPVASTVSERLDAFVGAMARREAFRGVVLVARGDTILLDKGYGSGNDAATAFRINSLVRVLDAVALLRLAQEGKVDLDAPLCRYLARCSGDWRGLRVRVLLEGGRGLGPPPFAPARHRGAPAGLAAWLEAIERRPPATWLDTGASDLVTAALLERLTRTDWLSALRRLVLSPTQARFDYGSSPRAGVPERLGASGDPIAARAAPPLAKPDVTALYARARDLYRLIRLLERGGLLHRTTLPEVFGSPATRGWTCCFLTDTRGGHPIAVHGGHGPRNDGWYALLAVYPRDRLTVIVLSDFSGSDVPDVERTVGEIALGLPYPSLQPTPTPVSVPPSTLRRYVGSFAGLRPVQIRLEGPTLVMSPSLIAISGGGADRLRPLSATQFFNERAPEMRLTFSGARRGEAADWIRISNARLGISLELRRAAEHQGEP